MLGACASAAATHGRSDSAATTPALWRMVAMHGAKAQCRRHNWLSKRNQIVVMQAFSAMCHWCCNLHGFAWLLRWHWPAATTMATYSSKLGSQGHEARHRPEKQHYGRWNSLKKHSAIQLSLARISQICSATALWTRPEFAKQHYKIPDFRNIVLVTLYSAICAPLVRVPSTSISLPSELETELLQSNAYHMTV